MAQNDAINFGLTVPTTEEWDVEIQQLQSIEINSQEFKELLVRLYQNLSNMSLAVNLKESAYYDTKQFVTSQQFFPNPNTTSSTPSSPDFRPVFRRVINFGVLPNGAPVTKSVAHGIVPTPGYSFTRIYGAASDTAGLNYIPLPYASAVDVAHNIELSVDATKVYVTTGGANRSNFNTCYILLEFMKW